MLFDWETAADLGASLGCKNVDSDTAVAVIKEFAARKYWRSRAEPARMAFIERAAARYFDSRDISRWKDLQSH